MPTISGNPKSSDKPIAPPRNSARSVAIAATSLIAHMTQTSGRGRLSRLSSARFFPVTIPSRADSA